jgi:hypothetical protein
MTLATGMLTPELRRYYGLRVLSLRPRAVATVTPRYGFASAEAKLDAFAALVAQCQHDGIVVLASAPRTSDLAPIGRELKEPDGVPCRRRARSAARCCQASRPANRKKSR